MSQKLANYGGLNTNVGKSPGLWGDCKWPEIEESGIYTHIDFRNFKLSTNVNASIAYWDQGCLVFGSAGAPISAVDAQNGGITIGSDGDNEGLSIQQVCFPFQIGRTYKRLWYEARVNFSTIGDNQFGAFIGLGESMTLSATVPIAAAGTIADQNLVGWHRLEGTGNNVNFIYKANGVTQVTVKTSGVSGGLTAASWIKLGFKWDQADSKGAFLLTPYVNGVRVGTTAGLAGYTMASADGTDFPNDVRMSPLIALLNATGTTPGTMSISDAWCAQQM